MDPQRCRLHLALGLVLCLCCSAGREDVVEVTVEGQGLSDDAAKRDALRKALEEGGRIEISSHSQVENFQLIRDTIYAKAEGIVTDYSILKRGDAAGGVRYCRIRARVSQSAVASEWGSVQNVLDQIGQPGIMVYIQERIDGTPQDMSILESQIENRLLAVGFDLYSRRQMDAIEEKELADAVMSNNVAKMQAIAKNFHTQIFITGSADANAAGRRNIHGEPLAMYNADGVIKMYYTDTGKLIASEPLTNCRGGARTRFAKSIQAGKKALQNCAEELAERCYRNAMGRWATRISAGGMIILEVEGISVGASVRIKRKLAAIDPDRIGPVNRSFSKGIATYRIKAKMTAADLVEHLVSGEWERLIEISDEQANRIQARWIGP